MSLAEKIQSDIVVAMKARDDFKLSVLRMVKAAIQLKEVEKLRKLDENESIQLLQTILKQRKESIDQFTKGGRPELAEKETKEAALIEQYLPAGASAEENCHVRRAAGSSTTARVPSTITLCAASARPDRRRNH